MYPNKATYRTIFSNDVELYGVKSHTLKLTYSIQTHEIFKLQATRNVFLNIELFFEVNFVGFRSNTYLCCNLTSQTTIYIMNVL